MKLIPITNGKSFKSGTADSKDRRNKFRRKLMIDAMQPLRSLLRSLSSNSKDKTLFELVLKENIRRAFDRHEPDIDYCKLLLSKGKLPMTRTMSVKSEKPGSLLFLWKDNSGRRGSDWTDNLFVALHHRASSRWFFELDAAIRADCKFIMDVFSLEGQMVDVYAGFVAKGNVLVSTSTHLGVLQIKRMDLGLRA